MKQITLNLQPRRAVVGSVCPGHLLVIWALYGYAMAILWRLAGENSWAQAATWVVALAAAAALVLAMETP